jgi:hypothetical protein
MRPDSLVAVLCMALALYVLVPTIGAPGQGELLLRRPLGKIIFQQPLSAIQETVFFRQRNLVTIRVPRDMDLNELIRMYQLEKSRQELLGRIGGRRQLRKDEVLRDIHLTPLNNMQ